MKTCSNCGQPIQENDMKNAAEILGELGGIVIHDFDDQNLCQACKEELGMLSSVIWRELVSFRKHWQFIIIVMLNLSRHRESLFMDIPVLAPGARVLIRDAEWLVRKVDRTATNRQAVSVVGLSQIVKDREAIFLDEIDQIELLNPEDTDLVPDTSSFYRDSLLFMESLCGNPADGRTSLHWLSGRNGCCALSA